MCHSNKLLLVFIKSNMCQPAQLTELVTDTLILQKGGMFKGVSAIEDPRGPTQRCDASQSQHGVVY